MLQYLNKTIAILLLASFPLSLCASANISNFHARLESGSVVITWNTESEYNVTRFDIQRSTDKHSWLKIDSINSHNGSSTTTQQYEYYDSSIFKAGASTLNYRIIVVNENGTREVFSVIASVSYSSGIKRTWGSLKAMFR